MPADLSGELLAGPYGFLVAIALLLYGAAREYRRGRQVDVATYQEDIVQLSARLRARDDEHQVEMAKQAARMQARDEAHRVELASISDDLADVKADLAALRDENASQLRKAALDREALIRENARLRTLLAESPTVTAAEIEDIS